MFPRSMSPRLGILFRPLLTLAFLIAGFAPCRAQSSAGAATEVAASRFGAKGDGKTDDTVALQRAIQYALDHHVPKLTLEPKARYRLASNQSQNTLVIYGENLVLEGNGATLVKDCSNAGYWGDVLDVFGMVPNRVYPLIGPYTGSAPKPARNVTVQNLDIECVQDVKYMNAVGVVNAENVTFRNVHVLRAPQTGFAVVAVKRAGDTGARNIKLIQCSVHQSGYHAYRISQQYDSNALSVTMDGCTSGDLRNEESYEKELAGHRVHVWYRAGNPSPDVSLVIKNCTFDATGEVASTVGASNLTITDNTIKGGINLELNRASGITITHNVVWVHRSNGYCLSLKGGDDVTVQDNTWVHQPATPLRITGTRRMHADRNLAKAGE